MYVLPSLFTELPVREGPITRIQQVAALCLRTEAMQIPAYSGAKGGPKHIAYNYPEYRKKRGQHPYLIPEGLSRRLQSCDSVAKL